VTGFSFFSLTYSLHQPEGFKLCPWSKCADVGPRVYRDLPFLNSMLQRAFQVMALNRVDRIYIHCRATVSGHKAEFCGGVKLFDPHGNQIPDLGLLVIRIEQN